MNQRQIDRQSPVHKVLFQYGRITAGVTGYVTGLLRLREQQELEVFVGLEYRCEAQQRRANCSTKGGSHHQFDLGMIWEAPL